MLFLPSVDVLNLGGRDTAGLGGVGGPYRLDAGHDVHQVPDAQKSQVPEEVGIGTIAITAYFVLTLVWLHASKTFRWYFLDSACLV